uniref:Uncharacterized protein n=1 Tax=Anguilla anguilla TaxID=7936 RepID=A0A0E9UWE3_ANGAN
MRQDMELLLTVKAVTWWMAYLPFLCMYSVVHNYLGLLHNFYLFSVLASVLNRKSIGQINIIQQ